MGFWMVRDRGGVLNSAKRDHRGREKRPARLSHSARGADMAGNLDSVKSIVVLMLENRSFDNILGYLYFANGNKSPNGDAFDGLTGNETNPRPGGGAPVKVRQETSRTTVPDP